MQPPPQGHACARSVRAACERRCTLAYVYARTHARSATWCGGTTEHESDELLRTKGDRSDRQAAIGRERCVFARSQ